MQGPLGAPPAEEKLDQAVDDEADPGKDENAPVKAEGFVARCGRQVGHEDEEVEETAEEDGGELL